MCQFKSMIILKDMVFVPDYESHTDMLKELKIEDTKENAERLFVRAELIPPDNDCFSDIESWKFKVDQDILPDWFVKEYEQSRALEAVKAWAEEHIHIGKQGLHINSGRHYVKDCKNIVLSGSGVIQEMHGSSTIRYMYDSSTIQKIYGSSTVQAMYGSSTIRYMHGSSTIRHMYDSSTVQEMCDSSTVQEMCDSSTVQEMHGSSTVQEMHGSSTVQEMCDSSTVQEMCNSSTAVSSEYHEIGKPETLVLSDNSTFKDCKNKILYQSGDWELRLVAGEE